jgi:hypothetical protein
MTPPHSGRAKKHLDCGPRPTRFRSWNRPETVERASIEARSEAPESHRRVEGDRSGRMFRRTIRLIGDEMLHRFGARRDRLSARLCALPEMRLTRGGPRHGPRSWGCCFAITEPDGAANGERRRMTRTHDKLRAASAEGRQCPVARVRERLVKRRARGSKAAASRRNEG